MRRRASTASRRWTCLRHRPCHGHRRRRRGPDRWLVLGPDRARNLLEVVVLITGEGDQTTIPAMATRAKYEELLDR